MLNWAEEHVALLAALSLVMFVVSLLAVPWVVARLPVDHFLPPSPDRSRPPIHWVRRVLKNLLGGGLLIAGLAMLIGPGQGVLTILLGLSFLDFPGKRALERRLVRRPLVARLLQWMRHRSGRVPLWLPGSSKDAGPIFPSSRLDRSAAHRRPRGRDDRRR